MVSLVSVGLLAGALFTVSQDAVAQSRRPDVIMRGPVLADDRRWDRDDDRRRDRYADRSARRDAERWRYDDVRYRRGSDAERLRRQRARHIEWCQRHRNDRRCADLYRRGNNWCWDRNHDNRCDYVDFRRRDSRGVMRTDRGPDWERWLRSSGIDVDALLSQTR